MPYFSRLTDIVTCNLTALLAESEDPKATLQEIVSEMQEGVAGALRSVTTAANNVDRISSEISAHRDEANDWLDRAKQSLAAKNDDKARQALSRKKEHEHLLAGLEQQLQAANSTRTHLHTMQHALQARLADAQRRLAELNGSTAGVDAGSAEATSEIDAELESLRAQIGG